MVIWLVGLSGSGKTTLGRAMVSAWRAKAGNVVLLDGDEIRAVFTHDRGDDPYTLEGRRRSAERLVALCELLDRQGIHVVCCVLSVFEDMRRDNRTRFSRYFEIFMDAPLEVVQARDVKGLYAAAKAGRARNVVGVDLPFPRPQTADLVIDSSGADPDIPALARQALQAAGVEACSAPLPYTLAQGDLLERPANYSFSAFGGAPFLAGWREQRAQLALAAAAPHAVSEAAPDQAADRALAPIDGLLAGLHAQMQDAATQAEALVVLARLLQRFEVTKRLHANYNARWRPEDPASFHGTERYLRFAELLEAAYAATGKLHWLNGLLKCMDTLSSLAGRLDAPQCARLQRLVAREHAHFARLAQRVGVQA